MNPFIKEWDAIASYLERFLQPASSDAHTNPELEETASTFQHISVWTILQFCENEGMKKKLLQRKELVKRLQNIQHCNQDDEVLQLANRAVAILDTKS